MRKMKSSINILPTEDTKASQTSDTRPKIIQERADIFSNYLN